MHKLPSWGTWVEWLIMCCMEKVTEAYHVKLHLQAAQVTRSNPCGHSSPSPFLCRQAERTERTVTEKTIVSNLDYEHMILNYEPVSQP